MGSRGYYTMGNNCTTAHVATVWSFYQGGDVRGLSYRYDVTVDYTKRGEGGAGGVEEDK